MDIIFCDGANDGVDGLVQLSNGFDNEIDAKRFCEHFNSKNPKLYKYIE